MNEIASSISPFTALQEMSEMSHEGILIVKIAESRVVYSNGTALKLLHLDSQNSLDFDSLLERVHWEDRDYIRQEYSKVVESYSRVDMEFRITTPLGDVIFVCCDAYLLLQQEYLVVSLKDISKAKEHENYLIEFGTKKNTMLETMAHQMKGALLLMQHLSSAAEKTALQTNDNLSSLLNLLKENSKYCIQVINDLIDDEQRKAPEVFIKKTRMNVVTKVKFILDVLEVAYNEKKFSFRHNRPSMYLNTDEFKLLQVLNNLASNSIKFTRPNGHIEISIAETTDGMTFTVSDDGIGIPPSMQPFIFHPFEIAGRPGLQGEKSTGHGLSISHQLVEAMNGKIWFESEERVGTSFHVYIPAQ